MYYELFTKKIWEGPISSPHLNLTAAPNSMLPLAPDVANVLSAVTLYTPVEIAEVERDEDGDWFRLESDDLWDHEVFDQLRGNWAEIGGRSPDFALLHFLSGLDDGVWVYHAKIGQVSAYPPGCHRVIS